MFTHVFRIATVTAGVVACTLLPFLPGEYDRLAVPVASMSQGFGMLGLLLVPVGALWLASGLWSRLAGRQYGFAIAALILSSVVSLMISLIALMTSGPLLALATLSFWIYAASRVWPRVRLLKGATRPSPVAVYLVTVPIAVVLLQMAVAGPATEFSRNRAIRNSAPLIADIERYRAANGHYPTSLLAVHRDQYKPSVMGIEQYHYEPHLEAYNVIFEQFSLRLGNREFVVYNPRDEQVFTSHRADILEMTPAQLALDRTRGHNSVHDAPQPHWKYFWFD